MVCHQLFLLLRHDSILLLQAQGNALKGVEDILVTLSQDTKFQPSQCRSNESDIGRLYDMQRYSEYLFISTKSLNCKTYLAHLDYRLDMTWFKASCPKKCHTTSWQLECKSLVLNKNPPPVGLDQFFLEPLFAHDFCSIHFSPSIIRVHLSLGLSSSHDGTLIQQVGQISASRWSECSARALLIHWQDAK